MKTNLSGLLGGVTLVVLGIQFAFANDSQYNMSLQDEVLVGQNGTLASPQALTADHKAQIEKKLAMRITDRIYRLSGWGLAQTIAVKAPKGWIIVDSGEFMEYALEQRAALEKEVGPIEVAAVLYTHSHYVWGGDAWKGKDTVFYGHEDLVSTLRGDQGVSILSGNFMTRASAQFGMLHPTQGADAFPNKLGFPIGSLSGKKSFYPPSVEFQDGVVETHEIGGMTVEVLPSKTDVKESVAYYFPELKLLASNALSTGSIFNLYTLRGDWYRDPMTFVEAVDLALSRDIEYHVDIHGPFKVGRENVVSGLQETRDQMQIIHDQTFRAIAQGKDAQGAAETMYMPVGLRKDKETYGQVESHVKSVYGARIGWMGWDVYDINPLAKNVFSKKAIDAMGGFDAVLKDAKASNALKTNEGWQWTLYLTSQLLRLENSNKNVKQIRAEAARNLGQRTMSANARGWYINDALMHEGKLKYGPNTILNYQTLSQGIGVVTQAKLAASPVGDNVNYLRFMVDPRLAEGKKAHFNVKFDKEDLSYAVALRNGIIAINDLTNDGVTLNLTKEQWNEIILGSATFANLDASLKAFDQAIGR